MSNMKSIVILDFILLFFSINFCNCADSTQLDAEPPISGTIIRGYRIIEIKESTEDVSLTVYRGDYLKFRYNDHEEVNPVLYIPALSIKEVLTDNIEEAPYIKMKATGIYPFTIGKVKGDITVIEYSQANYKEVTAKEAAELIENVQPLILDVRTTGEYRTGHLEDSVLIPLQELQGRWKEISGYKNQDILIYCATGNRSTVASKILIDKGFKRIYNMRNGISEWTRNRYPIKK